MNTISVIQRFLMAGTFVFAIASTVPAAEGEELLNVARSIGNGSHTVPISHLRETGPAGLLALLEANGVSTSSQMSELTQRGEIDDAIDAVAAQKDARFSRLYWYTNLESAKRESAASGKPILSLRLLGNLSDELSCANSRFFRSVLYANTEISDYLRENYILHWQSVRPVPIIEIDFGNGYKMRRTITGNSIHYILDSGGRIIDALPGLYAPGIFLRELKEASAIYTEVTGLDDVAFQASLSTYLQNEISATSAEKGRLLHKVHFSSIVVNDDELNRLSVAFTEGNPMDASSTELISYQNTMLAMRFAISKSFTESPMLKMIRNLQDSVARDTAQNEFNLRPTIREWLAVSEKPVDHNEFNKRVYADLFLTPVNDPYLGLSPADVYSGIANQGLERPNLSPLLMEQYVTNSEVPPTSH